MGNCVRRRSGMKDVRPQRVIGTGSSRLLLRRKVEEEMGRELQRGGDGLRVEKTMIWSSRPDASARGIQRMGSSSKRN